MADEFKIKELYGKQVLVKSASKSRECIIPEGVQVIGDKAFAENTFIESVVIPEGVEEIGAEAFSGCTNLTSISLPNSLTKIRKLAFINCSNLASFSFPRGVRNIEEGCFLRCARLSSVTIPSGITEIQDQAFSDCASLISVIIPDSVTMIGRSVFSGCTDLAAINIPDGITEISDFSFFGCTRLTSIQIPASVQKIGQGAFSGCTSLKTITLPDSVRYISTAAFEGCSSLTSFVVPPGVTYISDRSFKNCENLEQIQLPDGVNIIYTCAFEGCSKLVCIELPKQIGAVGKNAFKDTPFLAGLPDGLLISNHKLLGYYGSSSSVVVPPDVIEIGAGAFIDCTTLVSIDIPESVQKIGPQAFEGCSSLSAVKIPKSITSISYSLFWKCTSLTSVVLPDSVTEIVDRAFADCVSLIDITLPESISKIGDCFGNCPGPGSLPGNIMYIGGNAFSKRSSDIKMRMGTTSCVMSFADLQNEMIVEYDPAVKNATITHFPKKKFSIHADRYLPPPILPSEKCDHTTARLYFPNLFNHDINGNFQRDEKSIVISELMGNLLSGSVKRLSEYDAVLSAFEGDPEAKVQIALYRLLYPYELDETYRSIYIQTLKRNPRHFLLSLIEAGDSESISKLAELKALPTAKLQEYIDFAHKTQKTEIIAILLNFQNPSSEKLTKPSMKLKQVNLADLWLTSENEDGTLTITKYRGHDLDVEIPSVINDRKVKEIARTPSQTIFYSNINIKSVVIADGIEEIGNEAFCDCRDLQSVILPDSITTIGSLAFRRCYALKTIDIPESATSISSDAFRSSGAWDLAQTAIKVISGVCMEYMGNGFEVEIPPGARLISNYAFSGKRMKTLKIPSGLRVIGRGGFSGCKELSEVILPDGVVEIGEFAFGLCTSLKMVHIPKSVTRIGLDAFKNTPYGETMPEEIKALIR